MAHATDLEAEPSAGRSSDGPGLERQPPGTGAPVLSSPRRSRFWAALAISVVADLIQLALCPFFGEGAASPWNDALDVVVAVALTALLGWHWALLPAIAAELAPGVDLLPTWTGSVLFVLCRRRAQSR
jgi:hypothetical protein